jgi:enoyl-CoA hydratase/carnithine racemase
MNRLKLIKNQLSNSQEIILINNVENNKSIKIVTLNSGLNALSKELMNKLYETLFKLDNDLETKVIILTGKGKAFAAGADIKHMSKIDYPQAIKSDWFLNPLEYISYNITKPIIAAVNGIAYGGGFELALACDLIFASSKAIFGFPELKLGLFPGAGGTQRMTKLVGLYKTMEYILTTRDIKPEELKSLSVINDIFNDEQLLSSCIKIAEQIAKFSMISIVAAKKAMKMALETGLHAGLKAEKYLFDSLFGTEDKREGLSAFLNKKPAQFNDK